MLSSSKRSNKGLQGLPKGGERRLAEEQPKEAQEDAVGMGGEASE